MQYLSKCAWIHSTTDYLWELPAEVQPPVCLACWLTVCTQPPSGPPVHPSAPAASERQLCCSWSDPSQSASGSWCIRLASPTPFGRPKRRTILLRNCNFATRQHCEYTGTKYAITRLSIMTVNKLDHHRRLHRNLHCEREFSLFVYSSYTEVLKLLLQIHNSSIQISMNHVFLLFLLYFLSV